MVFEDLMKMESNIKSSEGGNYLGYYLMANVHNICRVCLEKSSKLMPIFDPVKPPHFSILMMACANVQVLHGDGLPPHICNKCTSRLNLAFHFKTQCESADAKLRHHLKNYNFPPEATHLNNEYSDENTVQDETGNTETLETYKNTPNTEINIEFSDEPQEGDANQVYNTNFTDADILGASDNVLSETEIQNVNFKEEFVDPDVTTKEEVLDLPEETQSEIFATRQNKNRKRHKMHQCETCGKVFKAKPSLVHHIRTHTGERPYVCHLCEKRFINGGHLHTHMKSHTGEKNHHCVMCSKAFTTAQQLTKHTIAIHTSERPYGCTYCSKRFASSSNLNTHLKIHTGEKNYHCETCGKKFSTKAQLIQHRSVHTGEKAYLCEYCNKRFSQKAHLIRHLKTHKVS